MFFACTQITNCVYVKPNGTVIKTKYEWKNAAHLNPYLLRGIAVYFLSKFYMSVLDSVSYIICLEIL
jgi:hypothetical protein